MKIIKKKLSLNRQKYFETHLNIVNQLLPTKMTDKEVEVLARFLSLDGELKNMRFSTTARKIVRNSMTPKLSPGGLGNYLRSLKNKGFIVGEDNNLSILKILIPEENQQIYQFKLTKNE